jgi:DNA-binding Lrp family transcriptional regulator
MNTLLNLLENDARLTPEQIAIMLDKEVGDIKKLIYEYEKEGVILGYKAMIDWDKIEREYVSAMIELKVTPQRDKGFGSISEKITRYPEVQSVYLMSGSFDILVFIEGRTMKEVAFFVAEKLSPMDSITSTSTHFVLRKYKDKGVVFGVPEKDIRGSLE